MRSLAYAFVLLAACTPDTTSFDNPIAPGNGQPPLGAIVQGDDTDETPTPDANTGTFDAGVGPSDGGVGLQDAGAFLDARPADAGTVLIPPDAGGAPSFPEGDQIP